MEKYEKILSNSWKNSECSRIFMDILKVILKVKKIEKKLESF